MLRVTAVVEDLFASVFEPIATQIVRKMMYDLDILDTFDNRVYINSDATGRYSSTNDDGTVILQDDRLEVEVVQNMNPMATKWETATFNHMINGRTGQEHSFNKKVIFHDETMQTSIFEQEVPANVMLNFTLKLTDRIAAHTIANKILTTYNHGDKFFVTDVAFNYPIPNKLLMLMLGLHKMQGAENDAFIQYLNDMSGERIGINVNRFDLDGSKQLVCKKNLSRMLVQLDYTAEKPEVQKSNQSTEQHLIEFSLTAQFSRPHMLQMFYPIHIYNQQVPKELLVLDPNLGHRAPDSTHPFFNVDRFMEYLEDQHLEQPSTVYIPYYDNWRVSSKSALTMSYYEPFLSIALTLDDIENVNGVTTIDLENDLPVTLVPEIIEQLQLQGDKSLRFDGDPVNVSVYTNDFALEPEAELELVNGTILTIKSRNIYPTYRLILSEYRGKPYGSITTFRVLRSTINTRKQR